MNRSKWPVVEGEVKIQQIEHSRSMNSKRGSTPVYWLKDRSLAKGELCKTEEEAGNWTVSEKEWGR